MQEFRRKRATLPVGGAQEWRDVQRPPRELRHVHEHQVRRGAHACVLAGGHVKLGRCQGRFERGLSENWGIEG
eukprot:279290-Pleurochrysis_carterae.AAC.1